MFTMFSSLDGERLTLRCAPLAARSIRGNRDQDLRRCRDRRGHRRAGHRPRAAPTASGPDRSPSWTRRRRPGRHQSGHNSGVLHAGVYYKPGSLKAQLCVQGKAAMERFADEHGIAVRDLRQADRRARRVRAGSARRSRAARARQRRARSADGRTARSCARSSRTRPASARCTRRAPASSTSAGWSRCWPSSCAAPASTSTSVTR